MSYFPNSIMQEMFLLIGSDSMIVGSNFTVTKGEPIQNDQNIAPWIGILKGPRAYTGQRVGSARPYGGLFSIQVYNQEYSEEPGGDTLERIEDGEQQIISLVTSKGNLTLGGTVDALQEISSELVFFDETNDQRFLTNMITLGYMVRV